MAESILDTTTTSYQEFLIFKNLFHFPAPLPGGGFPPKPTPLGPPLQPPFRPTRHPLPRPRSAPRLASCHVTPPLPPPGVRAGGGPSIDRGVDGWHDDRPVQDMASPTGGGPIAASAVPILWHGIGRHGIGMALALALALALAWHWHGIGRQQRHRGTRPTPAVGHAEAACARSDALVRARESTGQYTRDTRDTSTRESTVGEGGAQNKEWPLGRRAAARARLRCGARARPRSAAGFCGRHIAPPPIIMMGPIPSSFQDSKCLGLAGRPPRRGGNFPPFFPPPSLPSPWEDIKRTPSPSRSRAAGHDGGGASRRFSQRAFTTLSAPRPAAEREPKGRAESAPALGVGARGSGG